MEAGIGAGTAPTRDGAWGVKLPGVGQLLYILYI